MAPGAQMWSPRTPAVWMGSGEAVHSSCPAWTPVPRTPRGQNYEVVRGAGRRERGSPLWLLGVLFLLPFWGRSRRGCGLEAPLALLHVLLRVEQDDVGLGHVEHAEGYRGAQAQGHGQRGCLDVDLRQRRGVLRPTGMGRRQQPAADPSG